jgi:hypothetical protein
LPQRLKMRASPKTAFRWMPVRLRYYGATESTTRRDGVGAAGWSRRRARESTQVQRWNRHRIGTESVPRRRRKRRCGGKRRHEEVGSEADYGTGPAAARRPGVRIAPREVLSSPSAKRTETQEQRAERKSRGSSGRRGAALKPFFNDDQSSAIRQAPCNARVAFMITSSQRFEMLENSSLLAKCNTNCNPPPRHTPRQRRPACLLCPKGTHI